MNKFYFGDNLEILREMDAERVRLICTDPPFNSGRDYNAIINSLVRLPEAWRIRPTQKSERHFDNQQMQFLRG